MEVWIVTAGYEYESEWIDSVYSNPKAAYARHDELKKNNRYMEAEVQHETVID